MAVDVLATLKTFVAQDGKSINITPAISQAFGPAIGTAIQEVLSGGLQVNGVTFALSGDSATATVAGSGSAAPLLDNYQVSATFTAKESGVELDFVGKIQSSFPISNAWSALNEYPFTALTVSSGQASLDVNPGDKKFAFSIAATTSLDGTPLGTGLFLAKYDESLGFLAGFIIKGTWSPSDKWPVVKTLSITGEMGVFLASIEDDDLSDFDTLKLPYLPDKIDKGLTFIAFIELDGSLKPIAEFLPAGSNLSLIANLPLGGGLAGASVAAILSEPQTQAAFNLQKLELDWKSTSADSGEIDLTVVAEFHMDANDVLDLSGEGKFIYGTNPSLDLSITASGQGPWTHPFGIPNLQILKVSLGFTLSDEGINLTIEGEIEVGTIQDQKVILDVGTGILDFEAPSYVHAELSAADKDKSVTLPQLIDDFIPELDLEKVPLLNQIAFKELEFLAVAAVSEVEGKTYEPGIGLTGDISFFGFDLDFAFSLVTAPSIAVKAKGTISENGGPIVVNAGGIQILKLSDATGKLGPSACIDTTASGTLCAATGGANSYFNINAALEILGLVNASVVAAASGSSFEFDVALGVSSLFTEKLHCEFIPDKGDFAASAAMQFLPNGITLGPWGVIPQFTIPTPSIDFCIAFGTVVPTVAPCLDGWLPQSAPYFRLELKFTWGVIDFDIDFELDFSTLVGAFKDFGTFLTNLLLNSPKIVLDFLLQTAELLVKLLYQIGLAILKIVEAIVQVFEMAFEAAWSLVVDIVDAILKTCAVSDGNSAMSSDKAMVRQQPQFLSDLTASEKGQQLLYHYYLHRDELETRARQIASATDKSQLQSLAEGPGPVLARVIEFVRVTAAGGSPELQQSAAEVLPTLEQYRDLSYDEFVAALDS